MSDDLNQSFLDERKKAAEEMANDEEFRQQTRDWFDTSFQHKYSYNFTWMGRPIIQYPQDVMAMQELIWAVQPDAIIETGIAHGGSLIFYASMLELLGGDGEILGVDVDIREHNRTAIESHPMFKRITLLEGSSVSSSILQQITAFAKGKKRVMAVLDSNHTHEHVYRELELYAPFVTQDSYLVVFDTVVEDMAGHLNDDRPWGHGDNPKTAVNMFLQAHPEFVIDKDVENKLMITVSPSGFLKRIKD